MKTIDIQKIEIAEIGFYLKLIKEEHGTKSNKEYADLITEEFNILCTEKDIEKYEMLHVEMEDYEKLSRMAGYNIEQLIE